jgi:dienelactone hydrolase
LLGFGIGLSFSLSAYPNELIEKGYSLLFNAQEKDFSIKQNLFLNVVHYKQNHKSPFIILLHGRPTSKIKLPSIGFAKYPANSLYFASLGFAVIVPTRIGYGVTGGPDIEYTGECGDKNYKKGLDSLVKQTREIIRFIRKLDFIDSSRGLVLGESFGGFGAIAIAAEPDLPGIRGVVNIEGGDGGDYSHLDEPCQTERIKSTFAYYGKLNQKKSLWLYSKNDRFWGEQYPKDWFEAFNLAGGRGMFVPLPADKNNGHFIFNRNPQAWHPAFEKFIKTLNVFSDDPATKE